MQIWPDRAVFEQFDLTTEPLIVSYTCNVHARTRPKLIGSHFIMSVFEHGNTIQFNNSNNSGVSKYIVCSVNKFKHESFLFHTEYYGIVFHDNVINSREIFIRINKVKNKHY